MTKKGTREFNVLKGNLVELHRRIFDCENEYPHHICANWFVEHLITLMQNDDFKSQLMEDQVDKILEMSIDLLRTKLLDAEYKNGLIINVRELRSMKETFKQTIQV